MKNTKQYFFKMNILVMMIYVLTTLLLLLANCCMNKPDKVSHILHEFYHITFFSVGALLFLVLIKKLSRKLLIVTSAFVMGTALVVLGKFGGDIMTIFLLVSLINVLRSIYNAW